MFFVSNWRKVKKFYRTGERGVKNLRTGRGAQFFWGVFLLRGKYPVTCHENVPIDLRISDAVENKSLLALPIFNEITGIIRYKYCTTVAFPLKLFIFLKSSFFSVLASLGFK